MWSKSLTKALMTMWLITFVLGCGETLVQREIVYPPLPGPLILKSLIADKNDVTREQGWWINTHDMRATAEVAAKMEILRKAANKEGSP